jgi:Fe-Mn family superoxide dismutase
MERLRDGHPEDWASPPSISHEARMEAAYKSRYFDLSGLRGISDHTLETHFRLYEDYVRATNTLGRKFAEAASAVTAEGDRSATLARLARLLGFEYNGMVLHEHYFGNLKRDGSGEPAQASAFRTAADDSFGGYDAWRRDFVRLGSMRGAGWAITYLDTRSGRLSNHRIALNEVAHMPGFAPVLVMDGWEHAFVPDYRPAERPLYVESFFTNVDWAAVEARLQRHTLMSAAQARSALGGS